MSKKVTQEERKMEVVSVRMTEDLKKKVVDAAAEDHRTITDEIQYLISEGFKIREIQKSLLNRWITSTDLETFIALNEAPESATETKPKKGII